MSKFTFPARPRPLERLVDADPHWIVRAPGEVGGRIVRDVPPKSTVLGLRFDCPYHVRGKGEDSWYGCFVYVYFKNPFGAPGPTWSDATHLWERQGETFDALTLAPSIRKPGLSSNCEWHGFIRNGRFEHCSDAK